MRRKDSAGPFPQPGAHRKGPPAFLCRRHLPYSIKWGKWFVRQNLPFLAIPESFLLSNTIIAALFQISRTILQDFGYISGFFFQIPAETVPSPSMFFPRVLLTAHGKLFAVPIPLPRPLFSPLSACSPSRRRPLKTRACLPLFSSFPAGMALLPPSRSAARQGETQRSRAERFQERPRPLAHMDKNVFLSAAEKRGNAPPRQRRGVSPDGKKENRKKKTEEKIAYRLLSTLSM